MTDAELLERAAAAAHDAWWATKRARGFHPPEACPYKGGGTCTDCHKDMRAYDALDEPTKELDRAHVRAVHGVYAEELDRLRRIEVMVAEERKSIAAVEAVAASVGVGQRRLSTWLGEALAVVEAARTVGDYEWIGDDRHMECLRKALSALDDVEPGGAEPLASRLEEVTRERDDLLVRAVACELRCVAIEEDCARAVQSRDTTLHDYAEAHAERKRLRQALEQIAEIGTAVSATIARVALATETP